MEKRKSENMIKMVALDLDDTLLNSDIKISERNKKAIRACVEKGVHVTVATGRMFRAATPFARDLSLTLPIITYQGALVKTLDDQEILHHVIEKEMALHVIDFLKHYKMQVNVYMADELYMEKMDEFGSRYVHLSKVKHQITTFPDGMFTPPTKILMAGDARVLDEVQTEALQVFGKELTITKSKDYFLEFGNVHSKKSLALDAVAKTLQIKPEEIMAIGDGMNDYDMLEYAGIGVAMGNAQQLLKEIASYVTDTNDQDGVAKALEKYILS